MRIASYDLIEFQNLRKNIISGEYKTQNSIMFYLVKVEYFINRFKVLIYILFTNDIEDNCIWSDGFMIFQIVIYSYNCKWRGVWMNLRFCHWHFFCKCCCNCKNLIFYARWIKRKWDGALLICINGRRSQKTKWYERYMCVKQ